MADKTVRRAKILTMQPDAGGFSAPDEEDFEPASAAQKEALASETDSRSQRREVLRTLRKNKAAMISLGFIIFAALFAFAGPEIVPYSYSQYNYGSENLYPWHYSLEDQRAVDAAMGSPDERLATAVEDAEREKGAALDNKELAVLKAQIVTASPDEKELAKELGIKKKAFGYSRAELLRMEAGKKVFPHILGTDGAGRDILARTMVGTRISLLVGLSAALLVLLIGAAYGSIAGFVGGRTDTVMMRFADLVYSIPEMLLVLLIATALSPMLTEFRNSGSGPLQSFVGVLGPNIISMFIAFALLYWVTMARIVRGQILRLREQEFIIAAKALGAGPGRIIRKHLLPNCAGQIIVTTCLQIPVAIFLESFMSYLGVGVSAPLTSLGSMASDAMSGVNSFPYRLAVPTLMLCLIILAFNLFGDGLRDALDPKQKKQEKGAAASERQNGETPGHISNGRYAEPSGRPLLEVDGLHVSFFTSAGELKAVDGVSYSLKRGEIMGIVGESGSGKSTQAYSVMGLLQSSGRVTEGSITFLGEDISSKTEKEMSALRGKSMAMIFQNPMSSLNPVFTIGAQLEEALRAHDRKISRAAARRRAVEMLDMVGIGGAAKRMKQYPHEFSGGMLQRVMIAMALICGPELLIADEPTTALDVTAQVQILELLNDVRRKTGMGMIFITHDLGAAAEICDSVSIMYAGKIVEQGEINDIFHSPVHPYTMGLLNSMVHTDTNGYERLTPIEGSPADLLNMPDGCPFAPRCGHCMQICLRRMPPYACFENAHRSACWLHFQQPPDKKEESTDG